MVPSYPWVEYPHNELLNEYEKLKDKIAKSHVEFPIQYSYIGLKCSNIFFQKERMKTPSQNKISNYDFWKIRKNRLKVKAHAKISGRNLFSTLRFFNHPPAQFPVFTAAMVYKHFKATRVFDPFAGWGDRCLAAMACNIEYLGVDMNDKLKSPYDKMLEYYPSDSKNVAIGYMSSGDFDIKKAKFDFVFTSPPFWNDKFGLVEKYNDTDTDYDEFMLNILIPVLKKCMEKGVWVCVYIPTNMYTYIVKYIGKCKKQLKFNSPSNTKNSSTNNNIIYCFRN